MKKGFLLLLALLLLLPCAALSEAPQENAASETSVPSFCVSIQQGSQLHVTLPANSTTGYTWRYVPDDSERIELTAEKYTLYERSAAVMGGGGTWHAVFCSAPDAAGEAAITLQYGRSWESTPPAEEHILRVQVTEDGGMQLLSVESFTP